MPSRSRAEDGEKLRIAVFHADLSRAGPGLLLRDILAHPAPADISRAAAIIRAADADILLLQGFDFDAENLALAAFDRLIAESGAYPYLFALRPNTGWQSGVDLDGDGRAHGPRDAYGYGRFAGEGGMALLSRYELEIGTDFSTLLWRDLPGADLPKTPEGEPFLSDKALSLHRLSTTGHWVVRARIAPGRWLSFLAFHATPPGFDGPEDRNGRRSKDEHRLWQAFLAGELAQPPPEGPFVLIGTGNLDPDRGEGDRTFIASFLADPRWQDPLPLRGRPTALWPAPLGALRVSYILPSTGLRILDAGILPGPDPPFPAPPGRREAADAAENPDPAEAIAGLGTRRPDSRRAARNGKAPPLYRHLVWVDLELP